jgi:leader peptidase (prepilin peptidase) / N-methyltransferase
VVLAGVLGALSGPILRFFILYFTAPPGEPWRSGCPHCDVLRFPLRPDGRCGACRGRIGPPPALVEALAAGILAVLSTHAGPWQRPALGWAALLGVSLAFVDLRVHRLPDVLTAAFFGGTLLFLAASGELSRLGWALLWALSSCTLYLVLVLASPASMGLGDAKLALGVGLVLGWFGWPTMLLGLSCGFALAAAFGGTMLALRRVGRKDQIAHGPFMLLGALAALLVVRM